MPVAGEVAATRPTRLGRYELITRIGQGGMAEVQLALQRGPAGFEKLVVVKLVHNSLASQKAFVDMLLDEARVAALVKHPNVVDIYDLGQADGRYFIAMEYLEGEPLLAVLRAGREGKRLDTLSTGRLIADTAEGLDAAHELRSMSGDRLELVHHDISLGNIVVLYNGQVKLVDFGVAKATQTAGARSKVQGKFSYMAPEKLKGAAGDRRSDIFSLGCVMWEALTLKRLFRGGNDTDTMKQVLEMAIQPPSKVNGDVPPEYDPIVMRALDRDPDRRHSTAKEMAVEIEELLRKRGYGAKNDKIARYMQDTFRDHIDARKKLVQEVVNKGHASAEVLDAAFSEPVIASGSPVPASAPGNDFSLKYTRRDTPASGVPVPTAAWADSSPKTEITARPAHPMFEGGGTATDIAPIPDEPDKNDLHKPLGKKKLPAPRTAVPPAPLPPPPAGPATVAPLAASAVTDADMEATRLDSGPTIDPATGASLGERARLLFEKVRDKARATTTVVVDRARPILADKQKRLYVLAGAGVFLLLVIILAVTCGGGSKHKQVAATDDHAITAPGSDTATVASGGDTQNAGTTPGSDTSVGGGSDTAAKGSDVAAGSDDIEIGPPPPPPPSGSAHETGRHHETGKGSNEAKQREQREQQQREQQQRELQQRELQQRELQQREQQQREQQQREQAQREQQQREQQQREQQQHVAPPPPPPPPQVDAADLVNQGLKAFVTGDSKGALTLLNKAKAAKPGYAPTYRVLGKVYKKQGDKAAAKAAFQRYLKLAPSAPDADQIRKEMEEL